MIRKIVILVILVACYSKSFSQAGSFITIPLDAKSVAMGNTYIARESNNAFFTNLAASSLSAKEIEFNINYRPWMNGSSNNYNLFNFSGYYSLNNKSSLAIGYKKYTIPSYSVYDDDGNSSGTYTPFEQTLGVGYALNLSNKTALSLTFQYLSSDLGENYDASTVVFDFGYKSSFNKLDYGLMIKNVGPELTFDEQSSTLPLSFGGGMTYPVEYQEKHKLLTSLDVMNISLDDDSGIYTGLGLEYTYNNLFAFRSGYSYYDEEIGTSSFSLGTGMHAKNLNVDFSWLLSDSILKNNYAISCSWSLFKK